MLDFYFIGLFPSTSGSYTYGHVDDDEGYTFLMLLNLKIMCRGDNDEYHTGWTRYDSCYIVIVHKPIFMVDCQDTNKFLLRLWECSNISNS